MAHCVSHVKVMVFTFQETHIKMHGKLLWKNRCYVCPQICCLFLFVFALEGTQINSVAPGSSLMQTMSQYPSLGQVSHPYEASQVGKELNKYASLKAVGKAVFK